MVSTMELINNLLEIRLAIEVEPENAELIKNLEEQEKILRDLLIKKTDNIDSFILTLRKQQAITVAELGVMLLEVKRLRQREKTIENTIKHFNTWTLPMIINEIGHDNKLETSTAKYTAFQMWQVDEWDIEKLDDKFKRTETIFKYDKIAAKKEAIKFIKENQEIEGCKLKKVWNIRRS